MKIVILAGGRGTRLWPLSRSNFPKQFLSFGEGISLLQKTILRFLERYGASSIVVVTSCELKKQVEAQIEEIDPSGHISVVIEPFSKSTAPALCLAVRFLEETHKLEPGECILAAPSDGLFSPEHPFLEVLPLAEKGARKGFFSLLGKIPTRVETGYGYIKLGEAKEEGFCVEAFLEKPSAEKAEDLISSKKVLWNLGHLLFLPEVFWKELETHAPHLFTLKDLSYEEIKEMLKDMDPLSLEQGILEKSSSLLGYPLDSSWSDIGSWDNVYEIFSKDDRGNVKRGNIIERECKNSLFMSEKRSVVAIGVEDVFLIETEENILLLKKGESQKVKEIASISEEKPYKIEILRLKSLERKSFDKDIFEIRLVGLKGSFKVETEEGIFFLKENETLSVSPDTAFVLENEETQEIEVLVIQNQISNVLC